MKPKRLELFEQRKSDLIVFNEHKLGRRPFEASKLAAVQRGRRRRAPRLTWNLRVPSWILV